MNEYTGEMRLAFHNKAVAHLDIAVIALKRANELFDKATLAEADSLSQCVESIKDDLVELVRRIDEGEI